MIIFQEVSFFLVLYVKLFAMNGKVFILTSLDFLRLYKNVQIVKMNIIIAMFD